MSFAIEYTIINIHTYTQTPIYTNIHTDTHSYTHIRTHAQRLRKGHVQKIKWAYHAMMIGQVSKKICKLKYF
jgi:hypothetical protein